MKKGRGRSRGIAGPIGILVLIGSMVGACGSQNGSNTPMPRRDTSAMDTTRRDTSAGRVESPASANQAAEKLLR